jgi:CPA2 family monovalent cation:H+ antiporter-2
MIAENFVQTLLNLVRNPGLLPSIVILLGSAICIVVAFRKLSLSPVLGYLATGAIIGDHGLKIVTFEQTSAIAEYGIIFLLFAIGLELSFERLKAMRKYVFGLGSLQMLITSAAISSILLFYTQMSPVVSIVIGIGMSLSSTAIVLQVIKDMNKQSSQLGRISLAVLLQQDFTVIPLLVVVPILAQGGSSNAVLLGAVGISMLKAIVALCLIFAAGRLFLRPIFRVISSNVETASSELHVAATLLIVLAAAWSTEHFGLSLALGAFMAGILVAETEFRSKAEESIEPFKGLLLGLFFMSVGMTIDVKYIKEQIVHILFFSVALILIKSLIITALCILFKLRKSVSIQTGLLLSQGGEFAFILYTLATKSHLINPELEKMLLVIVTCTMALTPLLAVIGSRLSGYFGSGEYIAIDIIKSGVADLSNHVIILGLNQSSKMAANILSLEDIKYVIIDDNEQHVKNAQQKGVPAFHGDISSEAVLNAAGINLASAILISTNNYTLLQKILNFISNNYPNLPASVYTHNLSTASKLSIDSTVQLVPASQEAGLQMASIVLKSRGISDQAISKLKNMYRNADYKVVNKKQL